MVRCNEYCMIDKEEQGGICLWATWIKLGIAQNNKLSISYARNLQNIITVSYTHLTAIYESGKDITKEAVDGITYIGTENGEAIFELESGSYNFSSSVVNKSGLEEAISKGSTFGEFFYTPDSFKPLQDALAKAEAVQANKDATATEVQNAINAIAVSYTHLDVYKRQG